MALPMLVGGAECGPSNPLQNLSKKFDQDRGIQQDQFSTARAGSSRDTFRTQGPARGPDQDAARFFSSGPGTAPQIAAPTPFDLSALQRSLPQSFAHPHPQQHHQQSNLALASWASDFLMQQPLQSSSPQVMAPKADIHLQERERAIESQIGGSSNMMQGPINWNPSFSNGYRMSPVPSFAPQMSMQQQNHLVHTDQAVWDKEFDNMSATPVASIEDSLNQWLDSDSGQQQESQRKAQPPPDGDELARTAGLLVDSVRDEQNPKFKNSQFLGLMQQLRDREITVEGDKMVPSTAGATGWASEFQNQTDSKGKGKAVDRDIFNLPTRTPEESLNSRKAYRSLVRGIDDSQLAGATVPADMLSRMDQPELHYNSQYRSMAQSPRTVAQAAAASDTATAQDPEDTYFDQENAEYAQYWSAHHSEPAQHAIPGASQSAEWDRMQREWELFEANATGIKPVDNYQFQTNNPYLLGERSRTRQHMMHLNGPQSFYESVLELEAAVQRDPKDASAWYELGVKQQENEREQKAIQALCRAVDLDPTHLPTWVALAVSYTNDSNRTGTFNAINEWVERNDKYAEAVRGYRAEFPDNQTASPTERFSQLIQCLITMARSDMSGEIDADIQIALAVLLNTNEDYEKAQDCFRTALAVRPDDWLLYNRVGATMANSGKAEDALQYYYRALELNPAYIRARFNLGISCINLRRYEEAAQHILDALVLQDSDGVRDTTGMNDKRGVTSSALWDSLKTTCLHMQKIDLATLCDRQDLDGFRATFQTEMNL